MINIIDNSNKKNFGMMTIEELVKFLNAKNLTIEVDGDDLYRSLKISGEGKNDEEAFEAMSWLIKRCGNNYYKLMEALKGETKKEETPAIPPKSIGTGSYIWRGIRSSL